MLNSTTAALSAMRSTSAPAGTWLAIAVIVPKLSAKPIEVVVQLWVVR